MLFLTYTTSPGAATYKFFRNGQLVQTGGGLEYTVQVLANATYTTTVTIGNVESTRSNELIMNVVGES